MEEKAYIDIVANGLEKRIVEMKEEFNKKIDNIEKDNKERDKSINNMTKEIVLLSENMKINTESNKALTETINRLEKRLEDNKNALEILLNDFKNIILNDKSYDINRLKQLPFYPLKNYKIEIQDLILKKIIIPMQLIYLVYHMMKWVE